MKVLKRYQKSTGNVPGKCLKSTEKVLINFEEIINQESTKKGQRKYQESCRKVSENDW